MSKDNNLHDFLQDVADAIKEKKGSNDAINAQDFSDEIKNLPSGGSGCTGHADVEGLKAIGWTDEDIEYFQTYGVSWNEDEDEYYKVPDDNKALYGVLTADNIQTYKDRIVYLPKIDLSTKTNIVGMFNGCFLMRAIPLLDTSKVTNMNLVFRNCYSLTYIPPLDLPKLTSAEFAFFNCSTLLSIPQINLSGLTSLNALFQNSSRLVKVLRIDAKNITNYNSAFNLCYSLMYVELLNLTKSVGFPNSVFMSNKSILYMIENESATAAIVITLHADAYARAMADAEITAALAAHPNVSLASA
jgi:hypothetical protein